jgi:hypothetical protein
MLAFDLLGRQHLDQPFSGETRLDLPAGLYLLLVQGENGKALFRQKLVVR